MSVAALCIGNASYDIFFPLDFYPEQNKKYVSVSKFPESGGGPAANAAYLLSKWGVKTAFLGLLGDDIFGKLILNEFQETGIDTSLIEVRKGYRTGLSGIIVNTANGNRTIIHRKTEDAYVCCDPEKLSKISPEIMLLDGHEPDASLLALDHFPDTVSILDAGSLRPATKKLATRVDYLVCSEVFALDFSGLTQIKTKKNYKQVLETLFEYNQNHVIVTLGENGVIYYENGNVQYFPALQVKAKDTTAAGDIFHGAFTYGILKKMSLHDTVLFSIKAAGLSVQKFGSRVSIPDLSEVIPING